MPIKVCPHCGNKVRPKCRKCGKFIGDTRYRDNHNRSGLCRHCVCIKRNRNYEMALRMAAAKKAKQKAAWFEAFAATVPT